MQSAYEYAQEAEKALGEAYAEDVGAEARKNWLATAQVFANLAIASALKEQHLDPSWRHERQESHR